MGGLFFGFKFLDALLELVATVGHAIEQVKAGTARGQQYSVAGVSQSTALIHALGHAGGIGHNRHLAIKESMQLGIVQS